MHFLGMPIMAASRLRVLDVPILWGYNGTLFRKTQHQNNFFLDEYGIQRNLFRLPLAARKSLLRPTRIRSLDRTQHIRSVAALPYYHEFAPPHPDFFRNIASNHLILAYSNNHVLQQRFLCSSADRCCFMLENPLADNPLWVRIWVRVVSKGFAEILFELFSP